MSSDLLNKEIFNSAYIKADSVDEKNYTIDFVMSAQIEDRHGDIVDLETMQTDRYIENNVVLPNHDHAGLSVGKVIKIWYTHEDGIYKMFGQVQFAVEEYELAKTYWNLYKGGFMSAVSIGFIPHTIEQNEDGQFILKDCELLELSLVAVPANALALAKSKGVDINPLVKTMDKGVLLKEVRELLIDVKSLMVVEPTVDKSVEKVEEEIAEKVEEAEVTMCPKEMKQLRVNKLLNKAIRELKEGK